MKRLSAFLLLMIWPAAFGLCADANTQAHALFLKANQSYKTANYSEAVSSYEEVIKLGAASGPLYYNLGNSYFREKKLGRAILSYERALRLMPRDADVLSNIRYARSFIKNVDLGLVRKPFILHWIQALDKLSVDEMVIGCVLILVAISLIYLAGLWGGWKFRKSAGTLAILGLCFLVLVYGLFLKTATDKDLAVLIETTSARFEPDERATMHFEASEGWVVRVVKESGDWVKIERMDNNAGWVLKGTLEKI